MTEIEKKERKRLYDIEYTKKNKIKKQIQYKVWREANKDKKKEADKKYTLVNKDKKQIYDKEYRKKNADKKKLVDKEYYETNKNDIKVKTKIYATKNKDKINKRALDKKATDPLYKLSCSMRSLIKASFVRKGVLKTSKTEQILGCSYTTFKSYIESLWEPWMSWDNKGNPKDGIVEPNKTWDIDHIIPLAKATSADEIIKLNHYTNLQPLCSYVNRYIKKNN